MGTLSKKIGDTAGRLLKWKKCMITINLKMRNDILFGFSYLPGKTFSYDLYYAEYNDI